MTAEPILNAYLEDDGAHVVLLSRGDDGAVRERRVRATYATYHREDDLGADTMRALKAGAVVAHVAREDGGWVRVGWKDDYLRRQARYKFRDDGVDTREGDVDPVMYHLVSTGVRIQKPRRCYLDIETDPDVPLTRKEDMRVFVWAVADADTGDVTSGVLRGDTDDAEADLLADLARHLDGYDQVCVWEGDWNGGAFDSAVVPARWRRRGTGTDERRWIWTNQLAVWRVMNMHSAESGAEKESMKLDDIAFEQLGESKKTAPQWVVDRFGDRSLAVLGRRLWEAGGEARDLLRAYCEHDARLLHLLEKKKGYLTLFQAICEICGIPPTTDSLRPTRQMDGYLLRLGRARGHRFPTKSFRDDDDEEDKGKFRGAVVFHPKSVPDDEAGWTREHAAAWRRDNGFRNGVLRGVHVCDFKSLYPSVMRTWNLSAEAVVGWMTEREAEQKGISPGTCRSPGTGLLTRTTPEGFIPVALRALMAEREKYAQEAASLPPGTAAWQDAMSKSTACKVTANSFYGGGGSKYSRYNHRDVSEACTQNGVHFLKLTAAEGEKRRMVLVYGDTDSNMVVGPTEDGFRQFVRWINARRIPDEVAKYGCAENFVELAFEKSFDRIVFVTAKAYVGRYSQYKGTPADRECCGLTRRCKKGVYDWRDGDATVGTDERCPRCGGAGRLSGDPEIKGLAYKRGDKGKLARELQGRVIDLLVGGVKVKGRDGKKVPANAGLRIAADADGPRVVTDPRAPGTSVDTPTEDLDAYRAVLRAARDHVLGDLLPIDEVRQSRGLNKSVREYAKTGKSVPAHVGVAKALAARGVAVGKGNRVEYVVVDASATPMRVIAADDYAGECDRFYLWERVFAPTKALLEAAFPDEDWDRWGDVRPAKSRARGAKVADEQLGFQLSARSDHPTDADEIATPTYRARPLVVEVPEDAGVAALERLRDAFTAHPGARAVELVVVLRSGVRAVVACPHRVSTGPTLRQAVDRAIRGDDATA